MAVDSPAKMGKLPCDRNHAAEGVIAMEWMLMPLKRYAEFSGRSRRKEYWMYILLLLIVGFVLGFIEGAVGLAQTVGPKHNKNTLVAAGTDRAEAERARRRALYFHPDGMRFSRDVV